MARYIDADKLAEYITTNYCTNCDIYDGEKCNSCLMNDALNFIETFQSADVAPKSEVAREIFAEIEEALQYEKDLEDKNGRDAWDKGDTVGFHIHDYAEDKLETILVALSLFKKKYIGEKK